jgi:hypothetical protein
VPSDGAFSVLRIGIVVTDRRGDQQLDHTAFDLEHFLILVEAIPTAEDFGVQCGGTDLTAGGIPLRRCHPMAAVGADFDLGANLAVQHPKDLLEVHTVNLAAPRTYLEMKPLPPLGTPTPLVERHAAFRWFRTVHFTK